MQRVKAAMQTSNADEEIEGGIKTSTHNQEMEDVMTRLKAKGMFNEDPDGGEKILKME